MELEPGHWVRTMDPGIWQIERIDNQLDHGTEKDGRIAFCKRLVNDRFKRAFDRSSFHISLIDHISERERIELDRFMNDHPKVMSEFMRYHKRCDLLYNAKFHVSNDAERASFKQRMTSRLADLVHGLHRRELEALLIDEQERSSHTTIRNITIQFVSPDQLLRDGRPVFTEYHFLEH